MRLLTSQMQQRWAACQQMATMQHVLSICISHKVFWVLTIWDVTSGKRLSAVSGDYCKGFYLYQRIFVYCAVFQLFTLHDSFISWWPCFCECFLMFHLPGMFIVIIIYCQDIQPWKWWPKWSPNQQCQYIERVNDNNNNNNNNNIIIIHVSTAPVRLKPKRQL